VGTGESVSIVGRNGVGKSTLLELIIGRARRHRGAITLNGREITGLPIHERVRAGIGYVPQQREVFPSLTVNEHLAIAAQRVVGARTPESLLEMFPSLAARRDSLAGKLSGGEQQMLAIARALLTNPSVLLMDEPSEGLAPVIVDQLIGLIRSLISEKRIAVLLVEQRLDIALDLSQRCVLMERGQIVYQALSAEFVLPTLALDTA